MVKNFIKTQDEDTAEKLKDAGYYFVKKENNYYVFVNNALTNFANNLDQSKIHYSNKINI